MYKFVCIYIYTHVTIQPVRINDIYTIQQVKKIEKTRAQKDKLTDS